MYFSAKHIDIKLKQDYADFSNDDNRKVLILCDGIGEFKDSGIVAQTVAEQFITKEYDSVIEIIADNEIQKLKANPQIIGGTTFISAINKKNSKNIKFEYLGNGGIIHFYGDFRKTNNFDESYRFVELMNPHISPNGALTRHISNNSGKEELKSSIIEMNFDYSNGDIILLFSDGIASLEDKIILKDEEGRYWRNENAAVQYILNKLDVFFKNNFNENDFQNSLINFNQKILEELKQQGYLEDDASLGIILTEQVLNYYSTKSND